MRRNIQRVPRGTRRNRQEIIVVDRYSIISYGYCLHYGFYAFLLFCMYKMGFFTKTTEDRYYEFSTPSDNLDCRAGMEYWFGAFIWFCPIASVVSFYCMCMAKYNYNIRAYSIETWNKQY